MLSRRRFLAGLAAAPLFARAGSVDLGVCTDAAHFDDTVRYGFDYCEPDASEVAAMEPARFEEFRAQVLASPIRCLAFRSFIRKFQVVGPNLPPDGGRAYVDALLGRCQALGGEVMVFRYVVYFVPINTSRRCYYVYNTFFMQITKFSVINYIIIIC